MRKFSILLILISISLFSCKKKEETVPAPSGSNNNNNSGNSTATSWHGILTYFASQQEYNGTVLSPNYSFTAFFSNSPVPALAPSYSVTVDSIIASGSNLNLNTYYYSGSAFGTTPPINWQVYGNNGIPNFSFTNNNAMPTYTGYSSLPDSVSNSQSLTVSITGLSGYDIATVMLYDGTNFSSQVLASGSSSVTFSSSAMSNLTATNNGAIWVDLKKNNVQALGGKDFNFVNDFQFSKQIKVY